MTARFNENTSIAWSWAVLISIAVIITAVSRGTGIQQFGMGLLAASLALLVAMAIFELIWQIVVRWLDSGSDKGGPKSTPKHRQRGQ